MAYTPPTASDIKDRFPEFADVADARIEAVIAEAVSYVSELILERDYAVAYKYIVAHLLVREGALDTGNEATALAPGAVQSESLGDASVTYASGGAGSSNDALAALGLGTTEYGRRYLILMKKNFGGPMVV